MKCKRYRMRFTDKHTQQDRTHFQTFEDGGGKSAEDRAIEHAKARAIGDIEVDEVEMNDAGILYEIAQVATYKRKS